MKAINNLLRPLKPFPVLIVPLVLVAILIISGLFVIFLSPLGFLEPNLFISVIDESNWRSFYSIIVVISLVWIVIDIAAVYLFFKLRKNKNHFLNSIFTRWGFVITAIILSILTMLFGLLALLDLTSSDPIAEYNGGCVVESYERRWSIDYDLYLPSENVTLDIDNGIYSMLSSKGADGTRIIKTTCVLPVKVRYLRSTQLLPHIEYID